MRKWNLQDGKKCLRSGVLPVKTSAITFFYPLPKAALDEERACGGGLKEFRQGYKVMSAC